MANRPLANICLGYIYGHLQRIPPHGPVHTCSIGSPPQPCEQTDMIENITFPQTTYASGNQHSLTTSSSLFFGIFLLIASWTFFTLTGGVLLSVISQMAIQSILEKDKIFTISMCPTDLPFGRSGEIDQMVIWWYT